MILVVISGVGKRGTATRDTKRLTSSLKSDHNLYAPNGPSRARSVLKAADEPAETGPQPEADTWTEKEAQMNTNIGLWIDHRQATIVSLTGKAEAVKQIASGLEKHIRFSGGPEQVSAEDMRDRRFAHHLSLYLQEVITAIRDADSILIFGPGEAKGELAKQMERENLGGLIVGVETADKLTDRQIAAHVRDRFKA